VSKYTDNFEKIFGKKKTNEDLDGLGRVRYKAHPETGELVPDYMWQQLGMWKPKPKTHFVQRDYVDYRSEVGAFNVISGRRQHRYDLESNGCRVYEGRGSEARAAKAHNDDKDKRFEETLEVSLRETMNDLKYQNVKKETRVKSQWVMGEE